MFSYVEIPIWLLVLILLFAAVTFASHFLFPSVRWFFRRRMERVVARLNTRLVRPIEPFKLAHRHDTIQRLIYDSKVVEAVVEHAKTEGIPEDVAFEEAHRYAREIVPSFSATAYFGFGTRLARWLSETLFRVRLAHIDEAAMAKVGSDKTVIFVMNHRSNMDYVLVTYMAAERSALSYAVGEWARVWPLSPLIRSMGAYFIRRKSRNALYRRVLARYVQMATIGGVTQAVFPEGGLSLDGSVGEPKLGILSYIIAGYMQNPQRDVMFVPVAINYDRVLEDRVLVGAGTSGERKFRVEPWATVRYILVRGWQILIGRFHRYGYAAVSFGPPIALSSFVKDGVDPTPEVGAALMQQIRILVPVLPVPLVCSVLMEAKQGISKEALINQVEARIVQLRAAGTYVHVPHENPALLVELAIKGLVMRKLVSDNADSIQVLESGFVLIEYYRNSISHLLGEAVPNLADS
jgi:glycerol-3-phosphate O-acyltransferase